jgi:hypothetical protein
MGKGREPQIILKADERTIILEASGGNSPRNQGAGTDIRNTICIYERWNPVWQFRMHPRGVMGKARERQIILKAEQRTLLLESGFGKKFEAFLEAPPRHGLE